MFVSQVLSLFTLFLSVIVVSASPVPSFSNATIVDDLIARGTGEHNGIASYYYPGGGYGACGTRIQNGDKAVALSTGEWQNGALCGKSIRVTNKANGRTVTGVIVRDLCPGCQPRDNNKNNVDLTSGVFGQLDSLSKGLLDVVWYFED
ncbi:hypothetical protein Clacol_003307 [Clathrus columnatus]|uniref:Barwin domain-containing protein n=1 Tax=Clathrus columnatus TaxID=1419009 RepID=A0AAV5AAX8_9AGAM|nr:hypothetical protein Clacol_003307 [Clathrus columnatus]